MRCTQGIFLVSGSWVNTGMCLFGGDMPKAQLGIAISHNIFLVKLAKMTILKCSVTGLSVFCIVYYIRVQQVQQNWGA